MFHSTNPFRFCVTNKPAMPIYDNSPLLGDTSSAVLAPPRFMA
ncbi:hypothetical protein BN2497_13377 [Janthinobacterium sp. CG23_2]|nr:hypothetical protein BN2497_13377 [Janthinobacterium sp. CG23_2]CUU33086.1 hypothetical protein BN3177_13377 [Janthinobacterium sp. CG23_2]